MLVHFLLVFFTLTHRPSVVGVSSLENLSAGLLQFYSEDPNTDSEASCLASLDEGLSIDVIIDIAVNPQLDDLDRISIKQPRVESNRVVAVGGRFDEVGDDAARVYFESILLFLDLLQVDIEPSRLYSVLIDKGQKYYIHGRRLNRTRPVMAASSRLCIHQPPAAQSRPNDIQMTSLGLLTRLALEARDNGLPIVLRNTKPSITVYSIVVTDGSSTLPGVFLSSDRSKTTIIDIGKRRFLSRMSYTSMMQYANVFALQHPQQLIDLVPTVRFTACKIIEAGTGAK